jgi:hypothetical protein
VISKFEGSARQQSGWRAAPSFLRTESEVFGRDLLERYVRFSKLRKKAEERGGHG